jgi:hypothetical protein
MYRWKLTGRPFYVGSTGNLEERDRMHFYGTVARKADLRPQSWSRSVKTSYKVHYPRMYKFVDGTVRVYEPHITSGLENISVWEPYALLCTLAVLAGSILYWLVR